MPATGNDPLAALRDIHLPPEPGLWPPAPGWWLLALLLLLIAGGLAMWRMRARRHHRPQREALLALAALRTELAEGAAPHRVAAESTSLLRRVALARFPRRQVAGLTGGDWLDFLAAHGGGAGFATPEAAPLVRAPYAPRIGVDEAERIIALCERWIRAGHRAERPGPGTGHGESGSG